VPAQTIRIADGVIDANEVGVVDMEEIRVLLVWSGML
jgi:hypothetical protein